MSLYLVNIPGDINGGYEVVESKALHQLISERDRLQRAVDSIKESDLVQITLDAIQEEIVDRYHEYNCMRHYECDEKWVEYYDGGSDALLWVIDVVIEKYLQKGGETNEE